MDITPNSLVNRLLTPIPERMQHLPKDRRGYPIPALVFVDPAGKPHFTVNNEAKRQQQIARDACPICDKVLLRGRWFVGGPMSAFHPNGCYIDTGMHYECMEYACKVCPWLAAPNYDGRIDDKTIDPNDKSHMIINDPTLIPERPSLFVAVMTTKTTFSVHPVGGHVLYLTPGRPYKIVEFWQHGIRLSANDGLRLSAEAVPIPAIRACLDKHTQIRSDSQ
jgi:hypothetical protein